MVQQLCIIGNGMVTTRLLEKLTAKPCPNFHIRVFTNETHTGYNRVLLSPLLSGEQTLDDIITHPKQWYDERNIELTLGVTITQINRHQKCITDDSGHQYTYDTLIIATGSNPYIPPLAGNELHGVHTYRTIEDVERLVSLSQQYNTAVVIGGGVLGLEAAYGLKTRGMTVTVLHRNPVLMEKQLDQPSSFMLATQLQKKGIQIITSAHTQKLIGNKCIEAVVLDNGQRIETDLVVFAVGIRPNTTLAEHAGLAVARGILVNDQLLTDDPNIYSIGECIQHRQVTYGLVAPLYEQAEVCANHLLGNNHATYRGSITATGLKVTGIHLYSAGQFIEDEDCELIQLTDPDNGIYRKLVIKNNRLVGALLYGDITASLWYQELIEQQTNITDTKEIIMFGPDYLPQDHHPTADTVAAYDS